MSARDLIKSGMRNVRKAFGISDSHANEVEEETGHNHGSPVAEQVEGEEESQAVGGRSVGFEDGGPEGQEETTRERVMFAEPPPPSKEKDKPAKRRERGVVLVLEPGEKQGSTPRSQAKARKDPLPQVRV